MAETDSRILEYLEEGLFLYGVGKVQESIVRWRKVLELDPKNERAMDYIESAGGDVSQFRSKAGLPPRGSVPGPLPPAAAPPAVAAPPKPAGPPAAPSRRPTGPPVSPAAASSPLASLFDGATSPSTEGASPLASLFDAPAGGESGSPFDEPAGSSRGGPSIFDAPTNRPPAFPAAPPASSPGARRNTPGPMSGGAMPWESAVNVPGASPPSVAPPAPHAAPPPPPQASPNAGLTPATRPLPLPEPPPQTPLRPEPPPQPAATVPSTPAILSVTPSAPPPRPVAPTPAPAPAVTDVRQELITKAGALFQARAFDQSLELLERAAKEFPPVDDQLRNYLDMTRNAYYEVLKAQWPRPDIVPEVRMNPAQVMQLKLSPEAGFMFSRIDGVSTVEELLSMGGLDPFTTLRALSQLVREGVIGVQA